MEQALEPTADPAWVLDAEGYDPLREGSLESRFAISNGFLGIRGARATTRGARWIVPPRTYVAGLFDTSSAEEAISGLVPAADWLEVHILLPGGPMVHHPGDVSSHRMTLDLRRGALLSASRLKTTELGMLRLRTLRLVSLSERAVGLQLIQMEIEKGEIEITFEASFEGVNLGLVSEKIEQDLGVWRTHSSGKGLAMATASSLQIDSRDLPPTTLGPLKWSWSWTSRPGQVVCFERSLAVMRSDTQGLDPGSGARERLGVVRHLGWRGVLAEHEAAWASRWRCSAVEVDVAVYHLNSAANPADERVSISARALTGDDYHGHVFWDTEIYLLPFYILTWPEAARALLMYRFHTLDAARAKAAGMGWRGHSTHGNLPIPARRRRPSRSSVRIARSFLSFAERRSSTSARTSPTRSGNTGRRAGMKGFCSTPGPRSCSRPAVSGRAGLSWRQTAAAISAASSDRTNITSISTITPSPTSWHGGTSGAHSMWRRYCASAGPNAGRPSQAASAWTTLSWGNG
jgi:trehalose/maltose hydrolase-like predicted phosphorylase